MNKLILILLTFFNDQDEDGDNFDRPYFLEEDLKRYLCDIKKYETSLLFMLISGIWKLNCSNSFNIICVTEPWSTDKDFKDNSSFHFPNFDFIHYERKTGKKLGDILIYFKNDIKFKIIKDLSVSDGDNECVIVGIENKNSKNLLITCCYRTSSY